MRHDHVCAVHTVRVLCICSLVSAITAVLGVNMDMFTWHLPSTGITVQHGLDPCDRRSLHSRCSQTLTVAWGQSVSRGPTIGCNTAQFTRMFPDERGARKQSRELGRRQELGPFIIARSDARPKASDQLPT